MNQAYEAMAFARERHARHLRKYTGNPYFDHLAEVAGIVSSVTIGLAGASVMVSVAYLHDCVEDVGVTEPELLSLFGPQITQGVVLLSDLEVGNRATRKAASCARLNAAPGWVQTIKCADLISNTSSIVQHDPAFAKQYLEEKRMLLEVMVKADPRLRALAMAQAVVI